MSELLHRSIPYQASFLYQVGWVKVSPGRSLQAARQELLGLIQDDFGP